MCIYMLFRYTDMLTYVHLPMLTPGFGLDCLQPVLSIFSDAQAVRRIQE